MDKIGGAFESLTGDGGNTNQSSAPSAASTETQTQQQPISTSTTASSGQGIVGTVAEKIGNATGVSGRGGGGEVGGGESQTRTTEAGRLSQNVEQAKDEQIEEFERYRYRSSTGTESAAAKDEKAEEKK